MELRPLSPSSLLVLALCFLQFTSAGPYHSAHLEVRSADLANNNTLVPRQCAVTCGFYSQLCCAQGQGCYTDGAGQAQCTSAGALVAAATVVATASAQPTCTPNWAANESPCGPKCCQSGYYCANQASGQCLSAGAGGYTTTGIGGTVPTRVTTISGVIITMSASATITTGFISAVPTGQMNGTVVAAHHGLSGGAIAGIVIGVLLGIALLLLICFCCILKAGFDGLLALFGLGGKKRRSRRTVVEEEVIRHHRHGSASDGRRWHGAGSAYSRPTRVEERKTSRWGGGLGALAAGLGTAFAIDKLRGKKNEKSEYSGSGSSYGSYDSYYYGKLS
jgi:hypothetical protein